MAEIKYLGQKLSEMRVELQEMQLKKSGVNKFAGFNYFELADFLPAINTLAVKYKVCNEIRFYQDKATLTIENNEDPTQTKVFECTTGEATLKGCHNIQNVGAVQTYLRRYLYMAAYELVEHDELDQTAGAKQSYEKAMEIYNIAGQAGYSIAQVNSHIKKKFDCDINQLSEAYAKQVLAGYKDLISKKVAE